MNVSPLITLALLPLSSTPIFATDAPLITTSSATGVQETVRDRAIKFPALAHIPADAQMWLAINFTNTTVSVDKACGTLGTDSPFPEELELVDSVAIGSMGDSPRFIHHAANILACLGAKATTEFLQKEWTPHVQSPEVRETLSNTLYTIGGRHMEQFSRDVFQAPIPHLRVVVTAKPGYEAMLEEAGRRLGEFIRECLHAEFVSTDRKTIHTTRRRLLQKMGIPAMLLQGTEDSDIYLSYRMEGNSLIFTLADNVEKLTPVQQEEDSVLSTDKCACIDGMCTGFSLAAMHITPATLQALGQAINTTVNSPLGATAEVLHELAARHPQLASPLQQAGDGLQVLGEQLSALSPQPTRPLNITLWQDGDVHMLAECDACGAEFTTAQVRAAAPANALFHAYGSSLRLNSSTASAKALYSAARDIALGIAPTLSTRHAMSMRGVCHIIGADAELPMHLTEPLCRWHEGLGDGWVLTMDFAALGIEDFAFATLDCPPEAWTSVPAIRANFNVSNRALLEENRETATGLLVTLAGLFDSSAADDVVNMLHYTPEKQTDGSTLYTRVDKSRAKEGLLPSCTVTDTELTFATSPYVRHAYTGTPRSSISGWHFIVNISPFVEYAHNIKELSKAHWEWARQHGINDDIFEWNVQNLTEEHHLLCLFRSLISTAKLSLTTEEGMLRLRLHLTTPFLQ